MVTLSSQYSVLMPKTDFNLYQISLSGIDEHMSVLNQCSTSVIGRSTNSEISRFESPLVFLRLLRKWTSSSLFISYFLLVIGNSKLTYFILTDILRHPRFQFVNKIIEIPTRLFQVFYSVLFTMTHYVLNNVTLTYRFNSGSAFCCGFNYVNNFEISLFIMRGIDGIIGSIFTCF